MTQKQYIHKGERMMKNRWIQKTTISVVAIVALTGCGGSGGGTGKGMNGGGGSGSNIPYLKENHTNYKEHGSTQTPAPVTDAAKKSITWTIDATTEEGAIKLQEHLAFMEEKLRNDKNPRGWDKLFLLEAYMKYNKHYTTSVERTGTTVVVSKNANTACAYKVILAHSDAVHGDFFARGEIEVDYSTRAEEIIASEACRSERSDLETYIAQRQKNR